MTRFRIMIATFGALAMANTASATIIYLSDMSSDETDAGLLNATMQFTVVGTELTLTVTNNTSGSEYDINELYFNATAGITLSFDGAPGWHLETDVMADGFGIFDFALLDGQGGSQSQITPGETVSFTFQILTGDAGKVDFLLLSNPPPPDRGAFLVAKFVNGPGDDSAYGAAVPAPGVLALLGLAGLVSGRRRRRQA